MAALSYETVLNIIENTHRFGNKPGVEVTSVVLKKLGQPQESLPFIHIAGTNGKGSTCAFIKSILMETGLKVGVCTSPHLVDFRERIAINDKLIEKEEVTRIGNFLIEQDFGVSLTMFDYCLVMAILYFTEQNCDIAVIETGLGGGMDSTNALGVPVVSAITRIGYDHMAVLGDTLPQIAAEKAGIIKTGTRLVIGQQEKAALDVICHMAEEKDVDYIVTEKSQPFLKETLQKAKIKMLGEYQKENAAVAVEVAKLILPERKWGCIREGLSKAFWPGRMEILSASPFLLVDGAHNSNGVEALRDSLLVMYPGEKFRFIMGVMADKDYEKMIECLLPLAKDFVTVTANSDRALDAKELARQIEAKGVPARKADSLEEALNSLSEEEKNIAFGSLYFIGDIKATYEHH